MIRVMTGGGFDPCHEGHLLHFLSAAKLGDELVIAINSDEDMRNKKGRVSEAFWFRMTTIRALMAWFGVKCQVVPVIDTDGSVVRTLKSVRPDIFAKGGDRDCDANMPSSEVEICKELGIRLVYGVGEKLNSSSEIM